MNKSKILKPLFIIVAVMFAIPSIIYLLQNKTVFLFNGYMNFFLNDTNKFIQVIAYIVLLTILTILYFLIIKNRKKIFKSSKSIYLFIGISAFIFIFVLPFMSSDVFYYLGIGRLDSEYGQNPYYTTILQFVDDNGGIGNYIENDTVLIQGYANAWANTTVVYGPVWTFLCKIITGISFGNIDFALLIFKLISVVLHILNCYLIYKITNKKIFVLIYGLNPFVLLEGIANAHNDLYIITFVLASLYFLLKKKNIWLSILFLAIATSIKYFTILILPFILIYHFRNEKILKRLAKCIIYGIIFVIFIGVTYLIYFNDLTVFDGIFSQQDKVAKNIYVILNIIDENLKSVQGLSGLVNMAAMFVFIITYFFTFIVNLVKDKIKFREEMNIVNYFLLALIFILITNFQPWYLMWLVPVMMWQKPANLKLIIGILIVSQFANAVFMLMGEAWQNGAIFVLCMLIGSLIYVAINKINEKSKLLEKYNLIR